jgi:hypothetical protein
MRTVTKVMVELVLATVIGSIKSQVIGSGLDPRPRLRHRRMAQPSQLVSWPRCCWGQGEARVPSSGGGCDVWGAGSDEAYFWRAVED